MDARDGLKEQICQALHAAYMIHEGATTTWDDIADRAQNGKISYPFSLRHYELITTQAEGVLQVIEGKADSLFLKRIDGGPFSQIREAIE